MKPEIRWVAIVAIRRDAITQARVGLNMEQVQRYKEAKLAGAVFPPSVVFEDGAGVLWLADGFHRVAADDALKAPTTQVEVRKGERRDAWKHALGANAEHGLPRTREDLRRAVRMALEDPELGRLSNREIAAICKVSHEFVRRRRNDIGRPELEEDTSPNEVDPWNGETDPDKQRELLAAVSDPVHFEILLSAADESLKNDKYGPRRQLESLFWIRRCKMQAELAERHFPENACGVRQAMLQRSAELADRAGEVDPTQARSPKEFLAALAHKSLGADREPALHGLAVATELRREYSYVNPARLERIPKDWAIHAAVAERERKKAQERQQYDSGNAEYAKWFDQLQDDQGDVSKLPATTAWTLMSRIRFLPESERPKVVRRLRMHLLGLSEDVEVCWSPNCIPFGYFFGTGMQCPVCSWNRTQRKDGVAAELESLKRNMAVWPPEMQRFVLQQLLDPDLLALLETAKRTYGQLDHADLETLWIFNEAHPLPTLAVSIQAWLSGAQGRVIARPTPQAERAQADTSQPGEDDQDVDNDGDGCTKDSMDAQADQEHAA